MKFELTEIVAIPNPDEVLRVLEKHLRSVAGDVVRAERQVTAFGIGPSPRTVNRRDTTVIEARHAEGATVLRVSVTYQASALLGNMPQDDIVRSKIENAIDETRGQLKVWKAWGPPPGLDVAVSQTPATIAEVELPKTLQQERAFDRPDERWPVAMNREASDSLSSDPAPSVESHSAIAVDPAITAPLAVETEEAILEASPEAETPTIVTAAEAEEDTLPPRAVSSQAAAGVGAPPERPVIRLSKIGRKRAKRQAALKQTMVAPVISNGAEVVTTTEQLAVPTNKEAAKHPTAKEVPLRGLLRGQDLEEAADEDIPSRGRWKTALAVVVILLVATAGAGYAFKNSLPIPEPWKIVAADWSRKVVDETSSLKASLTGDKPTTPAPQMVAAPAPPVDESSSLMVTDPEVMAKPENSIYLWVQDWAAALRSKDPVAQASYYADTVPRYLDRTAVSHDEIVKTKKDAIIHRPELWSVKVEHIYIESQSGTVMNVRAIKRILSRTESGTMSEQRIKVRLKVVRADGTWKIVDEQELGPPASAG